MLVIQRPSVSVMSAKGANRQRFAIGPLEPGFGHTIGNSLRRTLLSSIPGAAVTQVRFEEAIHEFGTIQGVATDITDIILNLKDLVLTVHGDDPVTLRLDVEGPADVIAADIAEHPDVQILNPELPIAVIEGPDRLAMDVTVDRGRGYVSAEENKQDMAAIGVIPVDSIFSPVRRVSFSVGTTRVAQTTDYDRLVLDVETDGSITPREALASAGATLGTLIQLIEELSKSPQGLKLGPSEAAPSASADDYAELAVEDLELSERPVNCLKRAHINTLGDLLKASKGDLLAMANFGDKSLEEVVEMLDERGLALRAERGAPGAS